MAKRPVFIPKLKGTLMVVTEPVEFAWHPGMSKSQKQKSIRSLHEAVKQNLGIDKILEVSSKSETPLGIRLSAFNLMLTTPSGSQYTVEAAFQGSKVFSYGGPFTDIYNKTSREAKKDDRLKKSGHLQSFRYEGYDWPLTPRTAFYDWLYLSALRQNPVLAQKLIEYEGFTDIEFNPEKSINCQAASAALYKAMVGRDVLRLALSSPSEFLKMLESQQRKPKLVQTR